MKTINLSAGFILLCVYCASITSCNTKTEGDKATIIEEQEASSPSGRIFEVNTNESEIIFTGFGVGKKHPGHFNLTSGNIAIKNNEITGGRFVIDISSMKVEKGDIFQTRLKPHLLSGDFFDVEHFGVSVFEITHVEPYKSDSKDTSIVEGANLNISGNLTIKEVTRNITFPAKVDLDKNNISGTANFAIDRTQWKLNYGNDKTLGDKFISPTVNIKLDLKAKAN
jgi:polyisoprenoid-binding protein YceI